MLKVCIATTSFPRWAGDSRGTFLWEECRALQSLGVNIRVVTPHAPGAKPREILADIEIFRPRYLWPEGLEIPALEGGLPAFWRTHQLSRAAILPYGMMHALAVARLARGCDLIHTHWTLSAFAAWCGRPFHGKPLVCTLLGSDIYQGMRQPLAGWCARRALNGAQHVIAISRSLAAAAQAQGVNPGRMTVIPLGVDCDAFHPDENPREPALLFAGSLIERKGVRHLLAAMAEIHAAFPQHRLVIIGDGDRRAELEAQSSALGLSGSVTFLGAQSPEKVAEWMRRAEVFILPSLEEGQGVVLLEAQASGTPCVGSNVGGIPETLANGRGTLTPPGDAQALAHAVCDLLRQPEWTRRMGMQARQAMVADYDWKFLAGRILSVYDQALRRPSAN